MRKGQEGKTHFVEIRRRVRRGTARLKFNRRNDPFAGPVRELVFMSDIMFHRVSFRAFLRGNDSWQTIHVRPGSINEIQNLRLAATTLRSRNRSEIHRMFEFVDR